MLQHSLVGSVERRGISGGQRKRVNIGAELVAKPSLLFMDEPTSGLDATAATDILAALRRCKLWLAVLDKLLLLLDASTATGVENTYAEHATMTRW